MYDQDKIDRALKILADKGLKPGLLFPVLNFIGKKLGVTVRPFMFSSPVVKAIEFIISYAFCYLLFELTIHERPLSLNVLVSLFMGGIIFSVSAGYFSHLKVNGLGLPKWRDI